MELNERHGRWHATVWITLPNGERKRKRFTTGVDAEGEGGSRAWEQSRTRALAVAQRRADLEDRIAHGLAEAPVSEKARKTAEEEATLLAGTDRLIRVKKLANRSEATIQIVVEKSLHLLLHFGEERNVDTITTEDMERYAAAAMTERSAHTVAKELRTLREVIRLRRGHETPKAPDLGDYYQPVERWLSTRDVRDIVGEARLAHEADWYGAAPKHYYVMFFQTGCRYSELFKITARDVDLTRGKHGEVFIRGTKGRKRYAHRWVPLRAASRAVIEARLKATPEGRSLFPKVSKNAFRYETRRIAKQLGIEEWSPNDMRRTYATHYAMAGKPITFLKALMGHSPKSTILEEVYARVQRGDHMHDASEGAVIEINSDLE